MCVVRLRSLFLVSFAAALLAVGCGQGSPLSAPTAPTAVPGSTTLTTDGSPDASATASTADTFTTMGRGKDKDKHKDGDKHKDSDKGKDDGDSSDAGDDHSDHGRGNHGELSGFVTAVSTSSLTVRGTTVKVLTTTVIRHGHRILKISDIHVGDHVQARGTMDGTTLTATEIKVEDTEGDDEDDDAKVEGVMSAFSGTSACPASTFTAGATKVTTNSSTKFENVTCATLANGMTVEVKGARQTDGSILATKVEREMDEVEGTVSGLSGACATGLTFTIGTTKVTTSSTTTFTGVTCAAIANGTKVEVKGTKQTDGSIAAASVKLD